MRINRVLKPVGLAIPLQEVKDMLRITSTQDDAMLTNLINSAVDIIQQKTWVCAQNSDYLGKMDDYPKDSYVEILQYTPVTEITSVKYYDVDGTLITMTENTDYYVEIDGEYPRIYFEEQPSLRDRKYNNIEIAFKAGYLTRFTMPDYVHTMICLIVKDQYDNGGSVEYGTSAKELNLTTGIRAMLMDYSKRVPV
jgi:uncharacterized phiE125 gp8 family phage protein